MGIILSFVAADTLYDCLMEKFHRKSRSGIFLTYLPVVVLASILSDFVSFESESGVASHYSIFPNLPEYDHQFIATVIVSFLVLLSVWGRAGLIQNRAGKSR